MSVLTYLLYGLYAIGALITLVAVVLLCILGFWILSDRRRERKQERKDAAGTPVGQ